MRPARGSTPAGRARLAALAVCLAALAAAFAGADERADASWQAAAKGLTEGPLCSLVLQVHPGRTLDLFVPGGSRDAGWGKIDPTLVPLGTICLPDANQPERIDRRGDWSGGRLVATFPGGGRITIHASQLSPGIVVETSGRRLRLFSGRHEKFHARDDRGRLRITGFRGKVAARVAVTPHYAAAGGKGPIRARPIGGAVEPPGEGGWLLVGWGKATHFVRSDCPLAGRGVHRDAYLADAPLLLLFDAPPVRLSPCPRGGLDVTFAAEGGRVAVLPVAGARLLPAEVTAKWAGGLDEDTLARCDRLAAFGRAYPVSVRQSFHYDAAADRATFTETVQFLPIGKGGRKLAPLPPMAAVAMRSGMRQILCAGRLIELPIATEFGPIVGAAGSDRVTWTVTGLGRYVQPRRPPGRPADAPAELAEELARQVRRLLASGGLRPWCYTDNIPINRTRGELYWAEPGEVLYLLAGIGAALDGKLRADLVRYMGELRSAWPPEKVALIPLDGGKSPGGFDPGVCKAGEWLARERSRRVSVFALYGLQRCLALQGETLPAASWARCRQVLADAFVEQGAATLYLLGHGNRKLPWVKDDPAAAATSQWRGDRPGAVVNVNRWFAGAVGGVRLARAAGDAAAEQQAWWLLARSAVLRCAMGKLPAWRVRAGLAKVPPQPDWQWKLESGSWGGYLETNDWSRGAHDVRQVVELGQDGPRLDDWAGTGGDLWHQRVTAQLVAFRYMAPELADFLADCLRAESEMLLRRIELNQPTWYATFGHAILGWEHNMNHPSDAFQLYLARARLLGEPRARLIRTIDLPWLDRGDLFYMNKLAAAILTKEKPQ